MAEPTDEDIRRTARNVRVRIYQRLYAACKTEDERNELFFYWWVAPVLREIYRAGKWPKTPGVPDCWGHKDTRVRR